MVPVQMNEEMIRLLLWLIQEKYGHGWVEDKVAGRCQASLSIGLQMIGMRAQRAEPQP